MSKKKGLAGIEDYSSLKNLGYKDLLGLDDGFVYRNWSSKDPRIENVGNTVSHLWFPNLWGDSLSVARQWWFNIPHDYGRESKTKPRPAGYSFFADDGYGFGDYYEFVVDNPLIPEEHGTKKRVRLALFLNEPEADASPNEFGKAESAGIPADVAAHMFFFMNTFWEHIYWCAPCLSQVDPLEGLPWLDLFISTLKRLAVHSSSASTIERARPFTRWILTSFQWYPKGFDKMGPEQKHMCSVNYPIAEIHKLFDSHNLLSGNRKTVWITEVASPPAYVGPDYPAPEGGFAEWGPKSEWPGAKRWREWVEDMESNPYVEAWMAFTGTHDADSKQRFVLIDRNGHLTVNGVTFRDA